jgi:anthranilate synthase component 1
MENQMITPHFEEFKKRAAEGNLIPIYREILADLETPVSALKKLNGSSHAFLLESVEGGEKWGRYSFLGVDPSIIFRVRGTRVDVVKDGELLYAEKHTDPFGQLQKLMDRYKPVAVDGLPRFWGGAVGYFGYDTVRFIEDIPDTAHDDLKIYDAYFIITDTIIIFDNVRHTLKVVANVFTEDGDDLEAAYMDATNRITRTIHKLQEPLTIDHLETEEGEHLFVESNMSRTDYMNAVDRAKKHIIDGDIIQVVLSQRFELELKSDPFELYRALRTINPSPYMFYLKFDDITLVGSSPEVLVRKEGDTVELRPIAGTRPRGNGEEEDDELSKDLLSDEKERAEHIMLVDLGRNDLGRVSEYGSVDVTNLMRIEKYSHVIHIVSDIEGKLLPGKTSFDVIRAAFPAGTLSGAPKIRAMEIIDELEPCRRGTYGGCVGYFSFSGNMDMCITIRTMLIAKNRIFIQAGAGIVYDSVPEKEYFETRHKAGGMLRAVEMVRKNMRPV